MIAAQLIWLVATIVGLVISFLEFRHSQQMYRNWRDGSENGLGLQVASHQVRVSVANVVTHSIQFTIACLADAVMWLKLVDWNLVQLMLTGLTLVAVLTMLKQLIYRYDRALIVDTAGVNRRQKAHEEALKQLKVSER